MESAIKCERVIIYVHIMWCQDVEFQPSEKMEFLIYNENSKHLNYIKTIDSTFYTCRLRK